MHPYYCHWTSLPVLKWGTLPWTVGAASQHPLETNWYIKQARKLVLWEQLPGKCYSITPVPAELCQLDGLDEVCSPFPHLVLIIMWIIFRTISMKGSQAFFFGSFRFSFLISLAGGWSCRNKHVTYDHPRAGVKKNSGRGNIHGDQCTDTKQLRQAVVQRSS